MYQKLTQKQIKKIQQVKLFNLNLLNTLKINPKYGSLEGNVNCYLEYWEVQNMTKKELYEWMKDNDWLKRKVIKYYNNLIKQNQAEILYRSNFLNKLAYSYANSTGEKKEWALFFLERNKKFKELLKKQIARFEFEKRVIQGKVEKKEIDLERVKEVPIGDIIDTKMENNYSDKAVYICPIHSEKTGSFFWYKKSNSWYCFGCGEGESNIDLLMKMKGITFKEAISLLNVQS